MLCYMASLTNICSLDLKKTLKGFNYYDKKEIMDTVEGWLEDQE